MKTFLIEAQLTVVGLGAHLLDGVHVVDQDSSGHVCPACAFTVHHDDILQPRNVAQDVLGWQKGEGNDSPRYRRALRTDAVGTDGVP